MNMHTTRLMALGLTMLALTLPLAVTTASAAETVVTGTHETYDDNEVVQAANAFFANGAKDLGNVLGKVLRTRASRWRSSAARRPAARSASACVMGRARSSSRAARRARFTGRARRSASTSARMP